MSSYTEDDYLQLSGIQHFSFCKRQWALIHIEEQWNENYLTASGRILHNKTHNSESCEKRGDMIVFRALKVSSKELGVSGECDVVEFHKSENGIPLNNFQGSWLPYPVEYKRGKTKLDNCDRLQLCAQAVCLEEMLCVKIESGALYYGEPRRRETVILNQELRNELSLVTENMHELYAKKITPKVKTGKQCQSCSMKDQCLPKLNTDSRIKVRKYLEINLE